MKRLLPDFERDLQTIAERLYSNHAVVMVGAGFSRNASESYPDWNGLGNLFYSLLHLPCKNSIRKLMSNLES